MKEEKREKERLADKLRRTLELDEDILPYGYTLEVRGRSAATLRGAGKILLYTPEEIRLGVRGGEITVRGEGLICSSYSAEAVGIEGRIASVYFGEAEE